MRELVLKDAAYVGYTGRKMQAIERGEFDEVEPIRTTEGDDWLPLITMRTAIANIVPLRRKPGPWEQK